MTSLVVFEPEVAFSSELSERFYEIVDDRRVELPPMGVYGTRIASLLSAKIEQYAASQRVGRAVAEMLFRIRSNPNLQLRPDVAFVSFNRWSQGRKYPSTNAWDVVPDLVVEVVSPTNLAEEIPTRVRQYFEAGVRRAWVIYPHESLVYEYDSPRSIKVLGREESLDGGEVIPGFQLALGDLFEGTEEPTPAV